ncbi:MAG: trigger factor [Dehalococcoidales bacterium]|nr:trigger factor [Dehalococcoidales bacterium]MDD5605583.1 trigger factor [Dehalococcoidales bacterium]
MRITEKQFENCQAILTIEADEAEMKKAVDAAYKHAGEHANIPGFRKGKAPRRVLEKHVGKDAIQADAIEILAPDVVEKAIIEEKLDYYGRPQVEVVQQEPAILKATVPLPPKIELGDYKKLKTKQKKVKITSKQVDETLEEIRRSMSAWLPVERPAKDGDMLIIDLESNVEGKPFIKEKSSQYHIQVDKPSYLKGLAESFVGMKTGEEKTFDLELGEDYPVPEMAGKIANFQAKVLEVKEEDMPPADDELAKKVAPDVDGIKALKQRIKTNLENRENQKSTTDYELNLVEELVEKSKLEYPPILVNSEADKMIESQLRQWRNYSRSKEEFEERLKQNSYESLQAQYKKPAEERLRRSLVLTKFVEEEGITVTDEELDAEIERIASGYGEQKEERMQALKNPEIANNIRADLLTVKALQKLKEYAEKPTKKTSVKQEEKEETNQEEDNV